MYGEVKALYAQAVTASSVVHRMALTAGRSGCAGLSGQDKAEESA